MTIWPAATAGRLCLGPIVMPSLVGLVGKGYLTLFAACPHLVQRLSGAALAPLLPQKGQRRLDNQKLPLQTEAWQAYSCAEAGQEKVSSVKEQPALQPLLTRLRPGDTLVVWKLDRLGRSLPDVVTLVIGSQQQGVQFIGLKDHLDTTSAQGRLRINLFAFLAEVERDIIREQPKAGPTAERARGRPIGVSRAPMYRYLAHLAVSTGGSSSMEAAPSAQRRNRPIS